MKNRKIYALFILPLVGGALLAIGNNNVSKVVKADNDTKKELIVETPYNYDYEGLSVGSVTPEQVDADGLMWLREDVDASIREDLVGYKTLDLTIIGNDGGGYGRMIGIGSHGGLQKLTSGSGYQFTMRVDASQIDSNSVIYFEFSVQDQWTGVKIANGALSILDSNHVYNASYIDGVLSFAFISRDQANNEPGVRPYCKVTVERAQIGDVLSLGGVTIKETGIYHMDFEQYAIGTKVPNDQPSPIANIYSNQGLNLEIKEDQTLGHYLDVSFNNTGGMTWKGFYFNQLWRLTSGHKYRLSLDIYDHNYREMYLQYNDNGNNTFSYGPDGYIYGNEDGYVKAYYFDGTHLIEDIIFDVNKSADWWQQCWFLFCIPENTNFHAKIDNFNLIDLTAREVVSIAVKENTGKRTFAADEVFAAEDLAIEATRRDGGKFDLTIDQFSIDSSAFDSSVPGEKTINIVANSEYTTNNVDPITTLTASYKVTVQDKVDSIAVASFPVTEYAFGEELNLKGAKITKTYRSGTTETVAITADMVSYDHTGIGEKTVTITCDGCTTTQKIYVLDYDVSIAITTKPKTEYKYGELLSVENGVITVTTAGGKTRTVNMTESMVTGYKDNKLGKSTLTVTYLGMTTTYDVNVSNYAEFITLSSIPSKLIYTKGEELDLTGGKVTIIFANGDTESFELTSAMVTGYNKDEVGRQSLTVTYETLTTTFYVTVRNPAGCGGSIIGASVILSTLGFVGAIMLGIRKKQDK